MILASVSESMGYLVVFSFENLKAAHFFDDYDSAVDYINESNTIGDEVIERVQSTGSDDSYEVSLVSGQTVRIDIIPKEASLIRYDLAYSKNEKKPITRRYTKKTNAIEYAHGILDDLYADADSGEDEQCEWVLNDYDRNLSAHLLLTLVILSDSIGKDDYKLLNCSHNATDEEVKAAFKKMAFIYHPDKGGDAKKFAEIREAYERIKAGNPRKATRRVKEEYSCCDIKYIYKHMVKLSKASKANLYIEARSAAKKLMTGGIVMFLIGLILTGISSSSAEPGGTYVVFSGLIIFGIWRFLKGAYYYVNPNSLINKAMAEAKKKL